MVLILPGNGQKPAVTPYTGVSVLCCKHQGGGSATPGMSLSGVALPPTQSLLCDLLCHLEEVARISDPNCGLARESKVGILCCSQVLI